VKTTFGELRCNRHHLIAFPNEQVENEETVDSLPDLPSYTVTAHVPEPSELPLPHSHDGIVYTHSR